MALEDNIYTADMSTTGGALAFEGLAPPYEATLTKNLRDSGAIIIANTGMTELANYVAGGMPGNYNALAGYGMNPYDPRPRVSGRRRGALGTDGSSSGIGTAANFWAANVGTETSGSILSPSNQKMLAAIKPTVGRVGEGSFLFRRVDVLPSSQQFLAEIAQDGAASAFITYASVHEQIDVHFLRDPDAVQTDLEFNGGSMQISCEQNQGNRRAQSHAASTRTNSVRLRWRPTTVFFLFYFLISR